LNSLGEIRWTCAPGARPGPDKFALQYNHGRDAATTSVRLVAAGRMIKAATVNPGGVLRFPFLRPVRQQLTFVEGREPGTLRAVVNVDFGQPYRQPVYSPCWSYMPPPVSASIRFRPNT